MSTQLILLAAALRRGDGLCELGEYVNAGGDPDAHVRGIPLVHHAFEGLQLEPLELLVQRGADLDAPEAISLGGRTLLHHAVDSDLDAALQNGWPTTSAWTRFLLRLGASPDVRDAEGKTPRDIAEPYGPHALAGFDAACRACVKR